MQQLFSDALIDFLDVALKNGKPVDKEKIKAPADDSKTGEYIGVLSEDLKNDYVTLCKVSVVAHDFRREISEKMKKLDLNDPKYRESERVKALTYKWTQHLWGLYRLTVEEFFIKKHDLRGKKIIIRKGWTAWAVPEDDETIS